MGKALNSNGTGRQQIAQQPCQPCAVIFLARLGIQLENRNMHTLHGTLRRYIRQVWRELSTTGELRLIRHWLSGLRIADCTSKMHICDRVFTPLGHHEICKYGLRSGNVPSSLLQSLLEMAHVGPGW